MNFPLILFPAYGRKYATEKECITDWNAGKDFRIDGGPYCSKRDIEKMREQFGIISIQIKPGLYLPV